LPDEIRRLSLLGREEPKRATAASNRARSRHRENRDTRRTDRECAWGDSGRDRGPHLDSGSRDGPHRFERLVLQLMDRLGYTGTQGALATTAVSGDEGIDGVITLDKLGLDRIGLQAKRWQASSTVGRPDV